MKASKDNTVKLAVIAIVVFGLIFGVVSITQNWGKNRDTIDTEASNRKLDGLYAKLTVNKLNPKLDPGFQGQDEAVEAMAVLPDIAEYSFVVNPVTDHYLTIYASADKADWLIDVASKFNQSGAAVGGQPVSVGVRAIPSSLAADFISSGKYTPDVYAPVSEIYGDMLIGQGIKANLVEKRTAGNVAGIVITKKKNDDLAKKYGTLGSKSIIDSVLNGELTLGYTTPLSDEDGFSFILTLLSNFDSNDPLSDNAIASLRSLQDKVPLIAYDSDQLKAALTSGTLDAIVLNYHAYYNSPNLKASYAFVPIEVRHDSPVYEMGDLPEIKKQITAQFVTFLKSADSQKAASNKGFNQYDDVSGTTALTGAMILQAQEIYKKEKNGSSDLTAVFVADISGSMEGSPLLNLKASLNRAIEVISSDANVGLITFSDDVNIAMQIGKFENNQRSYFSSAIKAMRAGGSTAMFDAIVVAEKMLMDAKARNPYTKLMLFVLTDGEANRGYSFDDIRQITRGLKIPVYTIGYNANIDVLKELSNINEAATMNADSDNVIYRIESLFGSQM
jgi:Ca-activated chloride channel family protein